LGEPSRFLVKFLPMAKVKLLCSEVASKLAVKFLFTTKVMEELKWHTGQGAEYEKSDKVNNDIGIDSFVVLFY